MEREFLEKVRRKLEEERRSILEIYRKASDTLKRVEEERQEPGDTEDMGQLEQTKETLSKITTEELRRLREIEKALEKIREGTYGICEMCGEEIPKGRLLVLPWTPYCVKCSEQVQSFGSYESEEEIITPPPDIEIKRDDITED